MSGEIAANVAGVRQRIAAALARCRRGPDEVTLVAVAKGQSAERVRAAIAAGVHDVGENRMQEAQTKQNELSGVEVRWHFIGQLQTNKVKYLENRFSLVHSVDRSSLAEEISRRAVADGHVQAILVEVNAAREPGKAGVHPDQALVLCGVVAGLPGLKLAGLMAVPPALRGAEQVRPYFRMLRTLRDGLVPGGELSMGMSNDFEVAIEEGATLVRIGRAIFGPREAG